MQPPLAFAISVLLGFVVWGMIGARYIWPALRDRSPTEALRPVLLLHAFRFVGLAFVVPGVVSPELPAAFARPAAYGDLATCMLALLAIAMLGSRPGTIIVWVFNIVGTVDLLNAFYQADRLGVGIAPGLQGAAYFIPTVLVPLLLVTHVIVFRILLGTGAGVRGRKRGHIVNVSSLAGVSSIPFLGIYSASKFALEGYTEALRHEVKPFNIQVSLTEAGFLKTPMMNNRQVGANRIGEYDPWRQRALTAIRASEEQGPGPALVAETLLEIISSNTPRLRYPIGHQAKSVGRLRLSPRRDVRTRSAAYLLTGQESMRNPACWNPATLVTPAVSVRGARSIS